jgi:hypothetical protein
MSEKTELLPCPFCGSEAEEWSHRIDIGGDGCTASNVGCRNDECIGMLSAAVCGPWGYKREGDLPDNETARKIAVGKWNTRHLPPEVEKVIDDVRRFMQAREYGFLNSAMQPPALLHTEKALFESFRTLDSEGRK